MTPTGPSVHLSWAELACHDAARTPYPGSWLDRAVALAAEFESLRLACATRLGVDDVPLLVVSAFRTPEHNAKVGGKAAGHHLDGRAIDAAPPHGMDIEEFGDICLEQARRRGIIRGVGIYTLDRPHVHFDIRLELELETWRE